MLAVVYQDIVSEKQ